MRFILVSLLLGCLFAGCNSAPVATPLQVEVASCENPVGGPFVLPATAVEEIAGYDQELKSAQLSTLPEDLSLADVGPMEKTLLAYMLERRLDELPESLGREYLLEAGPMGKAILFAFYVAEINQDFGLDTNTLRRGLQRFYACVRGMPLNLEGFKKAVFNPDSLPSHDLHSFAKNTTRRLRGSEEAGVWMAETIVDGEVRETELILKDRRGDGALDFLAYDADGQLMDRSRFETSKGIDISGAAPYVCIICHSAPPTFFPDTVYPQLIP
ncbi:MAG TPA: hypothetical protein EYN06_01680 [Myxococcales bacterium]|nr:hypothetical protein [Myxococcales bacterium]